MATLEVDRENNGIEAHQVEFGKIRSLADTVVQPLMNDPTRSEGAQLRTKRHRMDNGKFQSCCCKAMHHGNAHVIANSTMQLPNAKFKVTRESFPTKKNETNNGIMSHCHFVANWRMGAGAVAARRIPCACAHCLERLATPWEDDLDPVNQLRFQAIPSAQNHCILKDVLEGHNDWKIVTVVPDAKNHVEEKLEAVFKNVLDAHATEAAMEVSTEGGCGAINAADDSTDGHCLVQWTGAPHTPATGTHQCGRL